MKTALDILSWPFLFILGGISAFLSIMTIVAGRIGVPLAGFVYGCALGIFLVVCRRERSAVHLGALVAGSTLAYPFGIQLGMLSLPGMFLLSLPARALPSLQQGTILPELIISGMAGVFGGFGLLLCVLLLFRPAPFETRAVLVEAAAGSLLSGVVGVVAWAFGPGLGQQIWLKVPWTLLPHSPPANDETFHLMALYAVWQPVMAIVVGILTLPGASPNPSASDEGGDG